MRQSLPLMHFYSGKLLQFYSDVDTLPLVLLTWMWLSVFVVLFGAEINGEAERQTQQDTTAGPH